MRLIAIAVLAGLLSAPVGVMADQGPMPDTEEAYNAEIKGLRWKNGPGNYQVDTSHSRFQLPEGIRIVTGADAERLAFLYNGVEYPSTVAVAESRTSDATVYFDYYDDGFITDDDWSDVDADALLESYRDGSEASNYERQSNGMAPIHTVGWLVPPTFDPATKTAHYAFELESEGERFANVVVLKLGRNGYHEITWAGPIHGADGMPPFLQTMVAGHSYDDGFRYADYVEGDKLAGFGIGALVTATALGSKPGKGLIAAIVGTTVLILKKGWFIVIGVLGAIGAFFKRLFNRGDSDSA